MSDTDVEEGECDLSNSFKLTIQTEELIDLVRSKPCLWNRLDVGYREKTTRDKAWEDVYKGVFPQYENLKAKMRSKIGHQLSKKWYNVRDAYVKSIRDPRGKRRPYIYASMLSFLDTVILGDNSRHNDSQVFLDEHSFDEKPSDNWLNESSFVDIDAARETPTKKPKLDKDFLDLTDNDNVVSILSKLINKEEDEDRAFFTSIVPTVKALSDNAKLEFKIKVMKLLREAKKKDKSDKFSKTNDTESE